LLVLGSIFIAVGNPERTVAFVSSQPLKEVPKAEQVENQTFVKNP
jgi:predicted glutamine amidotransferase